MKDFKIFIILSILYNFLDAKNIVKSFRLDHFKKNNCLYLTKYWSHEGYGRVDFNFTNPNFNIPQVASSNLVVYEDIDFHKEDFTTENDYLKHSCGIKTLSSPVLNLTLSNTFSEGWKSFYEGDFGVKRYYPVKYAFYLCDCSKDFRKAVSDIRDSDLKKDLKMDIFIFSDKNKSHLGREEHIMFEILFVSYLLCIALLAFGIYRLYSFRQNAEDIDYPLMILNGAPLGIFMAINVKFFHYLIFWFNGRGIAFLEITSRCWMSASDTMVCMLLVFLATGWGVKHLEFNSTNVPLTVILVITTALRYAWNLYAYWYSDDVDMNHIYDGIIGTFEILHSLFYFAVFCGCFFTGGIVKSNKYRSFRKMLFVLGFLFFLCRPLGIMITNYWEPMDRHIYALLFSQLYTIVVCAILQLALTNKRGVYMTISFSNKVLLGMEGNRFE